MNLKVKVLAAALAVAGTAILTTGGYDLIQQSEGKINKVYLDPVGIPTVCYGHTNSNLRLGMTFTDAECDLLFRSDVAKHQVPLLGPKNCIGFAPLNNGQRDALTSLTFNIGNGAFCKSTLARKLRVYDYAGASAEFPKWKNAKGKVLPGLVTRRAHERCLFDGRKDCKYDVKTLVKW